MGVMCSQDWIKSDFLTVWSPEVVAMVGVGTPDAQNLWKSGPQAVVTFG